MNRFKTVLAVFMAGFPLLSGKSAANVVDQPSKANSDDPEPVTLRPLNMPGENLFAAHRSHSSHASHRSGSGGSAAPREREDPSDGSGQRLNSGKSRPTDPGRPAPVTRTPTQPKPQLSLDEKRKLQVMQVQIALTSVGIYKGTVDGVLGAETKEALKRFQAVKGIDQSGLMTTDTLNALGVSAVK